MLVLNKDKWTNERTPLRMIHMLNQVEKRRSKTIRRQLDLQKQNKFKNLKIPIELLPLLQQQSHIKNIINYRSIYKTSRF